MNKDLDNFLDYLKKAGLSRINTCSPAWKLLYNCKEEIIDITIQPRPKKLVDITIKDQNGQKMSIGKLVRHRTVPALGLGLVVGESKAHKGFWMIQWCDPRYYDVGNLGIDENYLEIV